MQEQIPAQFEHNLPYPEMREAWTVSRVFAIPTYRKPGQPVRNGLKGVLQQDRGQVSVHVSWLMACAQGKARSCDAEQGFQVSLIISHVT